MAEPKTKLSKASVSAFFTGIKNEDVRKDCRQIAALMQKATRAKPKMWGSQIVGFGTSELTYADGSKREWMQIAFSPRKTSITLYLPDFKGRKEIQKGLGKFKATKVCLHITGLADVHLPTLNKLIKAAAKSCR